jgi:carboxymethylenebutenolidase
MTSEPEALGGYEAYRSRMDDIMVRSYYVQSSGPKRPALIVLRGIAGPDTGYIEIADRFARAGYASLVHYWQVRGDDPDDNTLLADIGGALDLLSSKPDVDAHRIAVVGYCKGGGQALLAAAEYKVIRAVVAFHGFARRPNNSDAGHRDPIEQSERIKRPVLLLHGEQDSVSPIGHMRELCAALTRDGASAQIVTYPNADHGFAVSTHKGFNDNAARDSFERAVAFLSANV